MSSFHPPSAIFARHARRPSDCNNALRCCLSKLPDVCQFLSTLTPIYSNLRDGRAARAVKIQKFTRRLDLGWTCEIHSGISPGSRVRRRSRPTFSTHSDEIFRRLFDGVVIYFFSIPTSKFFDDASEFSDTSLYVVFFSSKFMSVFLQVRFL